MCGWVLAFSFIFLGLAGLFMGSFCCVQAGQLRAPAETPGKPDRLGDPGLAPSPPPQRVSRPGDELREEDKWGALREAPGTRGEEPRGVHGAWPLSLPPGERVIVRPQRKGVTVEAWDTGIGPGETEALLDARLSPWHPSNMTCRSSPHCSVLDCLLVIFLIPSL